MSAHRYTSSHPLAPANLVVNSSHGHPFVRAHFKTSSCPPCAAAAHVIASHGVPFKRKHRSTSKLPRPAACSHAVLSTAGQPFRNNHRNIVTSPRFAAAAHARASHGHPCVCAHRSTSKCPSRAADAHVHSGNRLRLAGSGRASDLKTWSLTWKSLGRDGVASPA